MVILKLTNEEAKLLFAILPVDPELDGGSDSELYSKLWNRIGDAVFANDEEVV